MYNITGSNVNLLKVDCCKPVHTKCSRDTEHWEPLTQIKTRSPLLTNFDLPRVARNLWVTIGTKQSL